MRTFYIVALNQLKRTLRMRTVLINMFLLPLIVIFLLGTALGSVEDMGGAEDAKIDPVTLALVKSEDSPLLDGYLSDEGVARYLKVVEVPDRPQAQENLRSGEVDYALIAAPGFDRAVTSGRPASLELIRGSSHSENRVAENVLRPFIDALNDRSAAAKLLGPQALQTYEQLPAASAQVQDGVLGAEGGNYTAFQYYAAAMLVMFMMYSGLSLSGSLHGERENRTLQRMYAMPIRPIHLFAGKVAAAGAVAGLQALNIILISKWGFGVDWGGRPWMLAAVCLLMVVFTMGMAITVTFLTTTQPQSASIMQGLIVAMTFLSGGFVPFEGWIQKIGNFTVNRWASESILRMMLHEPAGHIGASIAILALVSAALLALALTVYRRKGYAYE
ncbi:ABC transporter permease [Saccharibacillus deserti]|uniref:ABC transporter permease n=1 Tax=Saccharibacillus deserti TaxID=1634444 RepID=UPI001556784A|nr:ABC transporter permease [Saccharibacillus deserti]